MKVCLCPVKLWKKEKDKLEGGQIIVNNICLIFLQHEKTQTMLPSSKRQNEDHSVLSFHPHLNLLWTICCTHNVVQQRVVCIKYATVSESKDCWRKPYMANLGFGSSKVIFCQRIEWRFVLDFLLQLNSWCLSRLDKVLVDCPKQCSIGLRFFPILTLWHKSSQFSRFNASTQGGSLIHELSRLDQLKILQVNEGEMDSVAYLRS